MDELVLQLFNRELRAPELRVTASTDALRAARHELPESLPDAGIGEQACAKLLSDTIAPALAGGQAGPHYYGFVTGGRTPISLVADLMVSSYDQNVQVHLPDVTISTEIEASAAKMVLDLLNIPRETYPAHTITTGATASNVLGLALAREALVQRLAPGHSIAEDGPWQGQILGYAADGHASIRKAAGLLGIGRKTIVNGRKAGEPPAHMDLQRLEEFLKDCQARQTGCVVFPSYGEVNTGAFTGEMKQIRRRCDKYGAWIHLDAAFGAFGALHPNFAEEIREGLTLADSLTIDAHKWLNVPYDCALFYARDPGLLHAVLGPGSAAPAYLASGASASLPSPLNTRIENSTRFRALPLYASLLAYGKAGYTDIVCRNIEFARRIEKWLRGYGKRWYDVLTDPSQKILNIVLFAPAASCGQDHFVGEEGATAWVNAINATGKIYVTGTAWEGRQAARLAVSNHLTAQEGFEESDFQSVILVLKGVMGQ